MIKNISLLILVFFRIFNNPALCAIFDIESTRMKSTGGTGVGSFYAEEATLLNPAPQAFFKISSLYFQKTGGDITRNSNGETTTESDNMGFIVSDSKGQLSGSVSYFKNKEREFYRKRLATSLSAPVAKQSAFGISYRQTKEYITPLGGHKKYHQTVFGISHLLNKSFNIGLIVVDPFKSNPNDTKAVIGMQYTYDNFLSLMIDAGADYNGELSETSTISSALQVKLFNDFFARFGLFEDKVKQEKGSGAGVAWVGPKLTFNVAQKNYEQSYIDNEISSSEKIKETSFSLSMRF